MTSAIWERLEEVRAGAGLHPVDPLIGSTLFDRYVILDLLGSGGMAKVYKALQISVERFVAIKTLRTSDKQTVVRFTNEIWMLGKLKHQNIVHAFDCFYDAGKIFFVMEFLPGMTLQKLLSNGKHLSNAEDVISIVGQLCDALSHAHKAGIIHRDLKPANVMLVDEGSSVRVKIVDFGIAKFEAELQQVTHAGVVVGTPMYMSPEQCMGEKVDERSDVYSLGALLYELLTGTVPYPGADVQQTMYAHCDPLRYPEPIESHVQFWPYAEQLNRIVQSSMETSREARFQTVEHFKRELQTWYHSVNEDINNNQSQLDIITPLPEITSLDPAQLILRQVNTTTQAWSLKELVRRQLQTEDSLKEVEPSNSERRQAKTSSPNSLEEECQGNDQQSHTFGEHDLLFEEHNSLFADHERSFAECKRSSAEHIFLFARHKPMLIGAFLISTFTVAVLSAICSAMPH